MSVKEADLQIEADKDLRLYPPISGIQKNLKGF